MWKCYQCGATGNPSGFAATTRELEAHFATSTHPVKNAMGVIDPRQCNIGDGRMCCKDGPVFSWAELGGKL